LASTGQATRLKCSINPIGEDTIKVFHAMNMRPAVLDQLRD
jgi:hypothetical protein